MILVTGGTGFIGKSLVQRLLAEKKKVTLLTRDGKVPEGFSGAEAVKGDILDAKSLKDALHGAKNIVHLAGMISYKKSDVRDMIKANVDGTRNVLKAAGGTKKFTFASSVSVYGPVESAADETYRLKPDTAYGQTKVMAEKLVMKSGIDYTILRIGPVYGPGSRIWVKILKLLDKRFPVPSATTKTQIIHKDDVAMRIAQATEKGYGIYNICDKRNLGFVELAIKISDKLGKKPRIWPPIIIKTLASPVGLKKSLEVWSENRQYIVEKSQRELGFMQYKNIDEGLREMVEWYKKL